MKNGELPISRVISIYNTDTTYFNQIETILTTDIIEKAHKENELSTKDLMFLPDELRYSYLLKNATLSTIMYIFLHCDGLSIVNLQKILEGNQIVDSLDTYIDTDSLPSKIKELYDNYLIDYGCIINLIKNGIISEQDAQQFNLHSPKTSIYNKLEAIQSIELTGATHAVPFSTTGTFIGFPLKNTQSKTKEVYRLLSGVQELDTTNMPTISHKKNDVNENGFLNKYKILPLPSANLVAFLPPEQTKPTYIMPSQEFEYILHTKTLPVSLNEKINENPAFVEIRPSEKMHEDILRTSYQFEVTKQYLESLGYSAELSFDEVMKIMKETFIKIKIKGE